MNDNRLGNMKSVKKKSERLKALTPLKSREAFKSYLNYNVSGLLIANNALLAIDKFAIGGFVMRQATRCESC